MFLKILTQANGMVYIKKMRGFTFVNFKEAFPRIDFMILSKVQYYGNFLYEKPSIDNIFFPKINIQKNINIFQLLDPKETQQSRIIGTLINPMERHGYGKIFLQLFFKYVLNDSNFIYSDEDKWIITIEKEGRFDIRIRNQINSKIIIVENKSDEAGDKENQLYRYWHNGIYKPQSILPNTITSFKKILYLSPGDWKRPDKQTVKRPENYDLSSPETIPDDIVKTVYFDNEIVEWLSACMMIVDKYSEMYYCLKQYQDFWR
jgi:hypothetical protein